ncbi:ABC transporter ATP-binding protein [Selenomonas sp. F0473]|uniref:ABC transporter ATP-binding protein n=1 Tax=Selenomonas sp. F0473 TaxID=999423 RepID=UPI0025FF9240|nr:ABC transporter ATP-binding protein [Selenomonas sp. F0473]
MNKLIIEMEDLVKEFPHTNEAQKKAWKTAVAGVSLSVGRGEVFGLLGPNGAGKTTIIRMLTMQTRPTRGRIRIGGRNIETDAQEIKKRIGVVPQHVNFDQELTVWQNMELHARLHHIGRAERTARIERLLAEMALTEVRNDSVRRLSGGMNRRLLIARALVHDPQILFLDEPTVALDPQIRRRIWDFVRELSRRGVTVFLTTHYIEEAEALCDRVAIINKGRLIAVRTPREFCVRLGAYAVEWDEAAGRDYRFFHAHEEARAYARTLDEAMQRVLLRPTNLEDVFIELTGRKEGL